MDRAPILRKFTRWSPQRWEPVHEQMVALSCRGLSNIAIGEMLGYSAQQVSNIINSPQGIELRQQYTAAVRKNLLESAEHTLESLQVTAIDNVRRVLEDKELAAASPFAMAKTSMDVLKGLGKMQGDKPSTQQVNNTQNNFILSPELQAQLIEGVARATRVLDKHLPPPEVEVKEIKSA